MTNPANFRGSEPTAACRVCNGKLGKERVQSGVGPYVTGWELCHDCGSWSVDREPEVDLLYVFYADYAYHHRSAAVNPGVNDGSRFTPEWRGARDREYRQGMEDLGLRLQPGQRVVDYGAEDDLFLDLCRSLQPELAATTAVNYAAEGRDTQTGPHTHDTVQRWLTEEDEVDVVTLWDVYEHVPDLVSLLSALTRRVVAGGQVLVQTPHASIHAGILGPLWHHFLPVQHLQLPSRKGIVAQFASAGFQLAEGKSFGANAPPQLIPQPYKTLFDTVAKTADLGSTQLLRFVRSDR